MGKHKPDIAPHVDEYNLVFNINAEKVALTGNKREDKLAYRHTGYPGGLRDTPYSELLEKNPERAVEQAERGMLHKNQLDAQQLEKLQVYRDTESSHAAK